MIRILKLCLHKQLIRITKNNYAFWSLVTNVINPSTLFLAAFEKKTRSRRKKTELLFSVEIICDAFWQNVKAYQNQSHANEQATEYLKWSNRRDIDIQQIKMEHTNFHSNWVWYLSSIEISPERTLSTRQGYFSNPENIILSQPETQNTSMQFDADDEFSSVKKDTMHVNSANTY